MRITALPILLLSVTFLSPAGAQDREDRVIKALTKQNAHISAEDRAKKYGKMAQSPFIFFRGTAHLYWHDLGQDERLKRFGGEKTRTWVQGDLHAENYGVFDDDRERIVYAINDFDEAVVADYQFDLWRMGTSLVLVGRQNDLGEGAQRAAVDAFTQAYRRALKDYVGNDHEKKAKWDADNTHGRLDEFLEKIGRKRERPKMLDEWAPKQERGSRAFDTDENEDLATLDDAARITIEAALVPYRHRLKRKLRDDPEYFVVKDCARRLNAGTGSLGTPRFYVLIDGEKRNHDDDRILDIKRQGEPSAWSSLDSAQRDEMVTTFDPEGLHAHRVIRAHKAMSIRTDDHLGWLKLPDGVYSVRERSPWKATLKTTDLDSRRRLKNMAKQWGEILAATHARADRDFDSELVPYSFEKQVTDQIRGHEDAFDALIREVAFEYADVVKQDHAIFCDWIADGDE